MPDEPAAHPAGPTLLWIGAGGCSGETQAILGVEGQSANLLDLLDDGVRLLWHPSLAERDLHPTYQSVVDGGQHLTVLCVEGSIATAHGGACDRSGSLAKMDLIRELCHRAEYVLAMGACALGGGWQAQPPNPSGAVGLQTTLGKPGGLLPPEWRSRAGLPVICLPGCPVPAGTQVAAIRWVLAGTPGGLDGQNRPSCIATWTCQPSTEYRGCGSPNTVGMRCYACPGPAFPNLGVRPLVRWVA
jgi:Ni,Fe-hydrogenase I small subunit